MITLSQGSVEYQENGTGSPLVFVPGSFSTGASWRGISTPLSEGYRTITTSLSGYGKTQERRKQGSDYLEDEMDVLDAVLGQVGMPVHIVAHSFGAWVVLALSMKRSPRLLSMTLLEPTVFDLLSLGGEAPLRQQVHAMTSRYIADWQGGDREAVRHVIDFYGGRGTFEAYPPAVKEKLIAQTDTNILDWKTGDSVHPTPVDLRAVQVPVMVIYGGASHMAMRRCNELLAGYLPQAQVVELEDASHFMIGTHAAPLTQRIEEHIRAAASGGHPARGSVPPEGSSVLA